MKKKQVMSILEEEIKNAEEGYRYHEGSRNTAAMTLRNWYDAQRVAFKNLKKRLGKLK